MKVYIVTEAEIEALLANIDRDPRYGERGGSSQILSKEEQEAFKDAHRFYNYQVRVWLDTIKK